MSGQMQKLPRIDVTVPRDQRDRVVLSDKDVCVAKMCVSVFHRFLSVLTKCCVLVFD